jgi:hypothetical protein
MARKSKLTKAQRIALIAQALRLPTPSVEFDAKLTSAARKGAGIEA